MSALKDVLSRKLFSQGGLLEPEQGRNLGGIIASSEPLMEAAKFANGGANFQLGDAPSSLDLAARGNPTDGVFDPITNAASTAYRAFLNLGSPDPDDPSREDVDARRHASALAYAGGDVMKVKNIDPSLSRFQMQPSEELLLNRKLILGESPASVEQFATPTTPSVSDVASAMGSYSDEGRRKLAAADAAEKERVLQNATLGLTPKDSLFSGSDPIKDATEEFFNRSRKSSDAKLNDAVSGASSKLYKAEAESIVLGDDKTSEGNLQEKQSLEDFLANVKTGSISEVDIEALKKKIGEAFDPLEKNPTTEGLLLAELGASIMNKGFKKGVLEGLPKITAYHDSQFKAKQKRKDDVTTLALAQKFKVADANIDISKEEAKQGSKTSSYLLLGSTSDWDKNYEKIDVSLSPRYLSSNQARTLSEEGVKVVEIKDLKELAGSLTGFPTKLDPKNTTVKTIEPFKDFGISSTVDIRVQKTGNKGTSMDKNQAKSLFGLYDNATRGNRRLKRLLDKVNTFKNEDIAGWRGTVGEFQQRLITLGLPKKYAEITGIPSGQAGLAAIEMRILAAELAPILLKESGKTISDADRDRIADIIGYKKSDSAFGGDVLMEIFLASPAKFQEVKNSLNQALIDQQMALNGQMASTLMRVGLTFGSGGLQDPTVRDSSDFEKDNISTIGDYGL